MNKGYQNFAVVMVLASMFGFCLGVVNYAIYGQVFWIELSLWCVVSFTLFMVMFWKLYKKNGL